MDSPPTFDTGSGRRVWLYTFVLCVVIVVARAWYRISVAEFWAEDGRVFLSHGLQSGWSSLLRPMVGSYQTIQRLVMIAVIQTMPIAWRPTAVAVTCCTIFAGIASVVAGRDWAWLIPSTPLRVATACAFCLLPGSHEMLGNLCNINWFLFAWLALVGLKDPDRSFTIGELLCSWLVIMSVGTSVLLLPLFAWRLARAVIDGRSRRYVWTAAVQVASITVFGLLLLVWIAPASEATRPPLLPLLHAHEDQVARVAMVAAWAGDAITSEISGRFRGAVPAVGAFMLVALHLFWVWPGRRRPQVQAVWLLVAGTSLWTVLVSFNRPYALAQLLDDRSYGLFMGRYSFPLSFAALVLWMCVTTLTARETRRRIAPGAVFVALSITLALHRFFVPSYGLDGRWQEAQPVIAKAIEQRCRSRVVVPIYPDGWRIQFRAHPEMPPCP